MLWPIVLIAAGAYATKRWFDAKKSDTGAPPAPTGFADGGAPDAGAPSPTAPPQDQGGGGGGGYSGGPNPPTQGSAGPYDPGYPMTSDPTYVAAQPIRNLAALKASAIKQPIGPLVSKTSLLLGAQPAPAPFKGAVVSSSPVVPSAAPIAMPRKVLGR